eukprot:NODE_1432_length_875_cov_140.440678_g1184_i0.p1 GENE.NODE_1432_length_875_cov_140.440678_g1184_i0~~NODE_1432_length_875_cov_140.440678_g1184_i0.p1  ORF type:complete len:201 (-),score=19.87 NODE_1432_length_875_cov_140.440678_g1184_i0:220-822(-)
MNLMRRLFRGSGDRKKVQTKEELFKELQAHSHFSLDEIERLHEHYRKVSSSATDDDLIDQKEFALALGTSNSAFCNRMFAVIDRDSTGTIDFREFIYGLSIFSEKGSLDDKAKFSFAVYDIDGDGFISKKELFDMLSCSLQEHSMSLPDDVVATLVDATFKDADKDGDERIDADEFMLMVQKHPAMLNNMMVDTSTIGKK